VEGEWELGVHIADVAHFAPAASPLDLEAQARGTSVYLPRRVIPMLPEQLSNGVCSLQEGVARFTKSVFIRFDEKGRVVGQRVAATVIRSAKRLTYIEAQALIDGDLGKARDHAKTEPEYASELLDALRLSNRLAHTLRERRRRDGMIALHLPQSELVFDAEGHVIDAVPEDASFTHTLIEMFMVEANEAVARLFADLELPLLRRIHPEPSYGNIEELRVYARLAKVDLPDAPTRKDIQYLLERTLDSNSTRAIHFAVLRSLAKASYSPLLEGHFALASEHYAHFTSPIRRYPDLLVHRALQAYLDATDNGRDVPTGKNRRKLARDLASDPRVIDEGILIELGNQCTEREIAAEEAERDLRTFLILQMLEEKHIGDGHRRRRQRHRLRFAREVPRRRSDSRSRTRRPRRPLRSLDARADHRATHGREERGVDRRRRSRPRRDRSHRSRRAADDPSHRPLRRSAAARPRCDRCAEAEPQRPARRRLRPERPRRQGQPRAHRWPPTRIQAGPSRKEEPLSRRG
jgi:ribonuclease R